MRGLFAHERLSVTVSSLPQLTPNERTAVAEYIARICDRFSERIVAVMLFGSKARGDAEVESDLDLLVLVDVQTNSFRSELWRLAADVSLAHNVVLSPRVFDRTRWDEARRLRLPLYRAIVADGIPLTSEPVPA
jgi:predicted nucleotidyltransferase